MLAFTLTSQIVYFGVIDGLLIGLLALGIVLIYRASGVINFAVGSLGVLSASLLALLVLTYGWPFWPAAIISVVAGGLIAAALELTVITRLFRAPRVILLVATIGIAQLCELLQVALPDIDVSMANRYPVALSGDWERFGLRVRGVEVIVIIVVPVLTVALTYYLQRTAQGRAIRAAASNPDLARLTAISPKIISTITWIIAGLLAAVALILVAGINGQPSGFRSLGPATLVQVLAAALIGRLRNFPVAMIAGVALGLLRSLLVFNWPTTAGLYDGSLFLIVIATTLVATRRPTGSDESFSFVPTTRPLPHAVARLWWVRHSSRIGIGLLIAGAAILPFLITLASRQLLFSEVLLFALIGISLVVLSGWTGQISLGQAALAGIGGLTTAALVAGRDIGVGLGGASFTLALPDIHFLLALLVGAAATGVIAVVIGLGALRIRGFHLAIATLALALLGQQFLWRRPFFSGGSYTVSLPRTTGPIDLTDQRRYYFFSLIALVVVIVLVARMRATGVGRRWLAVRDNSTAASAYTISPSRAGIQAFVVSGVIAGLGGGLLAGLYVTVGLTEKFQLEHSIQVVAIAVIGGAGTVVGPILGALWIVGLPAVWPANDLVPLLTSSIGLLVLLMYFPGGFAQVVLTGRDRFLGWYAARLPEPEPPPKRQVASVVSRSGAAATTTGPVLVAEEVTVAFGGLTAVDNASIRVHAGEVVGLIGTNGAGKTTLMNAISGFVPCSGRIELEGRPIHKMAADRRATLGLGRAFQQSRLFPDLTVLETLAVAAESRRRTSFTTAVAHLPNGYRRDRAQRAHAHDIADFLGLGPYADKFTSELSTGTRRIVELGCLLALEARVLCLDEPTGGVAQREVESFAPLLLSIKDQLGAAMLVIEHDMPMIMQISHRIYCLEAGRVIAMGSPAEVRADPAVIASYLGTDERAIRRSGATASAEEAHFPTPTTVLNEGET
ncbi:ABC transporter permease subunit [Candidatus Poriferisocius sp.]|uniref:ABC transporter permease subunit n=1 Tax=Candidatus Poriferisocius sp. TaxID=3101276 RepID=UPI003B01D355